MLLIVYYVDYFTNLRQLNTMTVKAINNGMIVIGGSVVKILSYMKCKFQGNKECVNRNKFDNKLN